MGKHRKQSHKKTYDPVETMRPTMLHADLELIARNLHQMACCGSKTIWPELREFKNFKYSSSELREKFVSLATKGMREAQNLIVERIKSNPDLSDSEEVLFRGIADSIAWQFLGNQLCHARRLFKEQIPPDLKNSNFDSVVIVANQMVEAHPDSMPLISDLTSFVQVGDLFISTPKGIIIAEVSSLN